MTFHYLEHLIKDFSFNLIIVNVFFFFPLFAIGNKLIVNLGLDGYIELYYSFFIFISLPLAILFIISKEISDFLKKKIKLKKKIDADSETVPLIKYLKFYNYNIDPEDKNFINKIINTKNLNLANNNGDTILHYISRLNPESLYIPLLLSCGADPYITNNKGETPLLYIDNIFKVLYTKKEKEEIFTAMQSNISSNIIKKSRI